jgi:hypothetical protein
LLKPLPKRAYERTLKETNAISDAQVKAHFAPKKPEAKPTYSEQDKKWAMGMLTQPPHYKMNLPSDYTREIERQSDLAAKAKKVQKAGNKFPSSENRRISRPPPPLQYPYGLQSRNG